MDFLQADGKSLKPEVLEVLRAGRAVHMDHYDGHRLPYACVEAQGVVQKMVPLEGESAGRVHEVIDASGGYASACLGAGHPVVLQALKQSVERAGYVTDELGSLERSLLLTELFGADGLWADRFPASDYHVSGRNSGSEGLEMALRLVLESGFDRRRLAPVAGREQRRTVLAFEGAWHGWTGGVVSLLNRRHYRVGLPDYTQEGTFGLKVAFLPFGELEALERFFAENGRQLAGVVVEPIQGDAGIIVPPRGYLRRLAALCREYEVLLVADEVLTFAKSGSFFAMKDEQGPIATDVTVIGKSLGMGALSTSMVIARRQLSIRSSGAVSTSDLRPLTSGVIRAGIRHMVSERLVERAGPAGEELRARLQRDVVASFPSLFQEVRGQGFMNGIELTEKSAPQLSNLRSLLLEEGLFVEFMAGAGRRSRGLRYSYPAMRIAPPLVTSDQQLQELVARIRRAASRLEAAAS
ncbi:aminotransferase class III-fold pyridoxal phosphate-dependent enzyme [Vitiosangium sp. GDMCC 1.1324]|uniref:aminotransferase class III-fold pyridoxal phosphate-dependent enzyme n=1 Tax=Vitiosangium sp. (strain GDMCC 1.1324) TaxID=2138576 RepID=UPI000D3CD41D|nr:aminotransferase class III-fold pyridoxal phosphate-dependent enzyme [Vitiosangium sp. GDMCC 1.1324]PTL80871.1 acetylornithine aminotransferase [Vitiosangium sp. GDMCC 1.1324]